LLVAGHPTENLRLPVQLLDEVVNVEIYRHVRLVLAGIGCRPSDVSHAMKVVYGGQADVAYPHFFRSDRPIVLITLCHGLPEPIVVPPGHHASRRGRYELGCIECGDLVDVYVAAEGSVEISLVSLEELSDAVFHH